MKPVIRLWLVLVLAAIAVLGAANTGFAGNGGRQCPSCRWDFRNGIDGMDWNVRLIPLPHGTPHPSRDLRLPTQQHMDYYLQNSHALALTPEGLRFTVRPGDAVVAGDRKRVKERSEIGRLGLGQGEKGQTCEYSMRFKLAPGGTVPTGRNFLIITQSHSRKDVDFPGGWTMIVGVAGTDKLKFIYGLNDRRTRLQMKPFFTSFGEWHDLTVRVYWSDRMDGWAEVYLDGAQVVPRVGGPNMPTEDAMEWKFGLYRGRGLTTVDTMIVQSAEQKVL